MEIDFSGIKAMATVLWAILGVAILMLACMVTVVLTVICAENLLSRMRRIKSMLTHSQSRSFARPGAKIDGEQ
jgi:glycerol-3-phosphate acyltransferase PlsY